MKAKILAIAMMMMMLILAKLGAAIKQLRSFRHQKRAQRVVVVVGLRAKGKVG